MAALRRGLLRPGQLRAAGAELASPAASSRPAYPPGAAYVAPASPLAIPAAAGLSSPALALCRSLGCVGAGSQVSGASPAAAVPLDAAPLVAGGDRAADVGRAGRQRVRSLVAALAVADLAAGVGAAPPAPSVARLHDASSRLSRKSWAG